MPNTAIKAENISKKFSKSLNHVMLYGAEDVSKNIFGMPAPTDRLRKGEFWAVEDVSFQLEKGQTLGIIGPNGAGKTTVLKMLNGIFMPDKGRIELSGRVGALIQVGAGFHPMLTGRENVYVYGAILGMSKKEIDKKFDEIVDFAEIGDFLDAPVRHYSSGMYVRLGFSIAVHCDPDIMLVDEVLAVGDARFYSKCTAKINEMTTKDTTIVLVSHNMWLIQTMCDNVILLKDGNISKTGGPVECIYEYSESETVMLFASAQDKKNVAPIIIKNIVIQDTSGKVTEEVAPEEMVEVNIRYDSKQDKLKGVFFIRAATPAGYPLYTSYSKEVDINRGEGKCVVEVPSISLLRGEYRLWAGFSDGKDENTIYAAEQIKFKVSQSPDCPDPKFGIFWNKVNWQI
ncbi:MAG: ATP-binding cassette domain-containing protein [Candidatus Omnitrophica bacterium]|nr:ATP-binding cassette domain-containing protein [Candidatus Omnitrophota bacterium]